MFSAQMKKAPIGCSTFTTGASRNPSAAEIPCRVFTITEAESTKRQAPRLVFLSDYHARTRGTAFQSETRVFFAKPAFLF